MNFLRNGEKSQAKTLLSLKLGMGERIVLENSEAITTKMPVEKRNSRVSAARRLLGLIDLPGSTLKRERKETTYLLVSEDVLATLKEQVPVYENEMGVYQKKIDEARQARAVSPSVIASEYKRRSPRPVIRRELERMCNNETDTVNQAMLEHPKVPVLIGGGENSPRVVVLSETSKVGVKVTLESTKHLADEKNTIAITVDMLPESEKLTFNGEAMSLNYGENRSLGKGDGINIDVRNGNKLSLSGLSKQKISVGLSKVK